jgi:hypothetical protein
MLVSFKRSQTSIVLRVKILDSSVSTGAGKTGLTSASSGLIISTIADNESSPTAYTAAGSTIETISTLGTYAAPTATKCRFAEVSSTNHPGVYEIQIADARFAVSNAKSLLVSITGATNAADCDAVIPLTDVNPYSAATFMTGVNGIAPPTGWNLPTFTGTPTIGGTGTLTITGAVATQAGTLPITTTVMSADATKINGVSTSSVTTINANLGTTQPVNFTGTGASATVKSDLTTIKTQTVTCAAGVTVGAFVGNANAALGVDASGRVDVGKWLGVAVTLDANNFPEVNAADIGGFAAPIDVDGHMVAVLVDGSLTTAKLGTFALAKTTNITGFNDLSAAQVNAEVDTALADVTGLAAMATAYNSDGGFNIVAIDGTAPTTFLAGATIGTVTTYTGNTPQTGDAYALIGANGAGLTALATAAALTTAQGTLTKLDGMLVLDGAVYQYTANALELGPSGGSAPTAVEIRQEMDSNSTQLSGIKAKTDQLTFTTANVVDSSATITGGGDASAANQATIIKLIQAQNSER